MIEQKKTPHQYMVEVMEIMGEASIQDALTVVVNLGAQLIVMQSEGKPALIAHNSGVMMENMTKAAQKVMVTKDQRRREEEKADDPAA